MKNSSLLGFLMALCAAGLWACAPSERARQDAPALPFAMATDPSMSTSDETGSRTDKTGGAAIVFQRSGGFAGISEKWTVFPDGKVMGGDGQEFSATPGEVESLISDIENLGFFDWSIPRQPIGSCADCFTYNLTVSYEGRLNSITVVDGTENAPEGVWEVIKRIDAFFERLREGYCQDSRPVRIASSHVSCASGKTLPTQPLLFKDFRPAFPLDCKMTAIESSSHSDCRHT